MKCVLLQYLFKKNLANQIKSGNPNLGLKHQVSTLSWKIAHQAEGELKPSSTAHSHLLYSL